MTTQTLTQAPAAPKASHQQRNKSSINQSKGNESESFETQLDEATPPSETPSKKDLEAGSLSEVNTDLESSTPQTTPTADPIQTLFPSQMLIKPVESPKPETTEEKPADGIIFSLEEKKSTKSSLLDTKPLVLSNNNQIELTPSFQKNPNISPEAPLTVSAEPPPSTTPTVQELLASVSETPTPIDSTATSDTNPLNLIQPENLKSVTTQAKPESITLGSQHRLETVLDSVLEEKPLPTPRRIEVKLQTPQGSQITLYIARVNQELRAQFSANNHQAFAWLQSEITQLKTLNSSEAIRWLPAQIESTITKSENSGKSSQGKSDKDKEREGDSPLESIFDLFKPSTRRLA